MYLTKRMVFLLEQGVWIESRVLNVLNILDALDALDALDVLVEFLTIESEGGAVNVVNVVNVAIVAIAWMVCGIRVGYEVYMASFIFTLRKKEKKNKLN